MSSYVQIHSDSFSWFKPIIFDKHLEMIGQGIDSYVAWGRGREPGEELGESGQPRELKLSTNPGLYRDALLSRLDDRDGFHSKSETRKLIKWLDAINPSVVHLHQLHGYYLNIEMLFNWLACHDCRVVWTLHDCWAFTGHCSHFTYVKCEQWKSCCACRERCPQLREYPKTLGLGACKRNFEDKKRLFTSVPPERMSFVTPSHWLANLVDESFLSGYSVEVRHNKIDRAIFKPTKSDFRARYGIGDRFMILGVANPWTARKGLKDFIQLAAKLDDNYAVVLVGLSPKQIEAIPNTITQTNASEQNERVAGRHSLVELLAEQRASKAWESMAGLSRASAVPSTASAESTRTKMTKLPEAYALVPDLISLHATTIHCGGAVLIACEKTDNQEQLAAIYSAANLLFNPTYEDNYPTVNLEAEACGTPVWTYDTGGCRETISLSQSRILG